VFFFFFFLSGQRRRSLGLTSALVMSLGLTWQQRRNVREARGGAGLRVGACARMVGEPETFGDAWGLVQGWIRPILVAMDKS
jgi:hypothetical protein